MKKIILVLALLLVVSTIASARMSGVMMSGAGSVTAGGGGCSLSSGDSCTVTTDDTTSVINTSYIGQGNWYPASNMNICQIDVWVVTAPTSGTLTGYVFNMSSTSLGTEVCHTESKDYSTISTGAFNTFSITGDCNVTGGGGSLYGIVWVGSTSAWDSGDKAVSGGCSTPGGMGVWGSDKDITNNYFTEYDQLIRVYGK